MRLIYLLPLVAAPLFSSCKKEETNGNSSKPVIPDTSAVQITPPLLTIDTFVGRTYVYIDGTSTEKTYADEIYFARLQNGMIKLTEREKISTMDFTSFGDYTFHLGDSSIYQAGKCTYYIHGNTLTASYIGVWHCYWQTFANFEGVRK